MTNQNIADPEAIREETERAEFGIAEDTKPKPPPKRKRVRLKRDESKPSTDVSRELGPQQPVETVSASGERLVETGAGEFVTLSDFTQLDTGQQRQLMVVGPTEFNRRRSLAAGFATQQAVSRRAPIVAAQIKIGRFSDPAQAVASGVPLNEFRQAGFDDAEIASVEQFVKNLNPPDRAVLQREGLAGLRARRERQNAEISRNHVQLADGSFISREEFNTLPPEARNSLLQRGAGILEGIEGMGGTAKFAVLQAWGFVPKDAEFIREFADGGVQFETPLSGPELREAFLREFPSMQDASGNIILPRPLPQTGRAEASMSDDELMRQLLGQRQSREFFTQQFNPRHTAVALRESSRLVAENVQELVAPVGLTSGGAALAASRAPGALVLATGIVALAGMNATQAARRVKPLVSRSVTELPADTGFRPGPQLTEPSIEITGFPDAPPLPTRTPGIPIEAQEPFITTFPGQDEALTRGIFDASVNFLAAVETVVADPALAPEERREMERLLAEADRLNAEQRARAVEEFLDGVTEAQNQAFRQRVRDSLDNLKAKRRALEEARTALVESGGVAPSAQAGRRVPVLLAGVEADLSAGVSTVIASQNAVARASGQEIADVGAIQQEIQQFEEGLAPNEIPAGVPAPAITPTPTGVPAPVPAPIPTLTTQPEPALTPDPTLPAVPGAFAATATGVRTADATTPAGVQPQPRRARRPRRPRLPGLGGDEAIEEQAATVALQTVAWRQGGLIWIAVRPPYGAVDFTFPRTRPNARIFNNAREAFAFVQRQGVILNQQALDRWSTFFLASTPLQREEADMIAESIEVERESSNGFFDPEFEAELEAEAQTFAQERRNTTANISAETERILAESRELKIDMDAETERDMGRPKERRPVSLPSLSFGRAEPRAAKATAKEVDF